MSKRNLSRVYGRRKFLTTVGKLAGTSMVMAMPGVSTAGKIWQPPIQQALNEHSIPRLAANTSIETSTLGHHAELIGAATLVMEHYDKESLNLNPSKEGMVTVH